MITFVILAAGRGTRMGRVGESLHKALVPLAGRAALSHLIGLAPPDAKIVICVGYRSDQVRDYVRLAHPKLDVDFIQVANADGPESGPGQSLLEAADAVEGGLVVATCDTLWAEDLSLWSIVNSWVAVAPVPAGTPPRRWCRIDYDHDVMMVTNVVDKTDAWDGLDAWTGLAYIAPDDLETFWSGLRYAGLNAGERQIAGGLRAVCAADQLGAVRVHWTDVGDDEAYRRAVAQMSGYDWTKTDQATYVLPETGRVVKHAADPVLLHSRIVRGERLGDAVPAYLDRGATTMVSYPYIDGLSGYEDAALEEFDGRAGPLTTPGLVLAWMDRVHGTTLDIDARNVADRFYRIKTFERILTLKPDLFKVANDAVNRVDWDALSASCVTGEWHGDLNYSNVVITPENRVYGIDWRENFGGGTTFGDQRYDLAKLIAGTVVHWDRARRGDFRPWELGPEHAERMRKHKLYSEYIEIIGALTLLNSAPLHAAPLDEVLVARGVQWLEEYV